jgi:hypothetical protein
MTALRLTVLFVLFGLTSLTLPSPARAQDDATVEAARERFKEGVQFFDNKEYERARLAFVQAYALKPHPAILLNMAQSEIRSGHEASAATHFAQYLREHVEATEEQRQAAREGLETAKASIAVVNLTVEPSDAEILVDGKTVGRSPLNDPLYLSPGEHTIVAQKGGETARRRLTVEAGGEINERLTIGAAPARAPAAATAPGEEADEVSEAEEGGVAIDSQDLEDRRQPFIAWFVETPLAWVGAGLTLAAVGSGTVLAITAKNYYQSADGIAGDIEAQADKDPRLLGVTRGVCNLPWGDPDTDYEEDPGFEDACSKYKDRVDTGDDLKLYSRLSFGAAVAFAAGTIVYYFLDAPLADGAQARAGKPGRAPKSRVSAQLVPIVGPGQSGLVLQGTF